MHLPLPAIKAHALSDPDKVLRIRAYATLEKHQPLPPPLYGAVQAQHLASNGPSLPNSGGNMQLCQLAGC